MIPQKIVVVGGAFETNVGRSLHEAASNVGLVSELVDFAPAFAGPKLLRTLSWRFNDRKPLRLNEFSEFVVGMCEDGRPDVLMSTGIAPISSKALQKLGTLGIALANFQTDDPWNEAHRSNWYLKALAHYDFVFTPRSAAIPQLRAATPANVGYLPFGYDARLFYPEADPAALAKTEPCDVIFAGGADQDRIAEIRLLTQSGLTLGLYGGYWDRHDFARPCYRGMATPATLRSAHANAKVAIGMVRRANRDGNSMRTFELGAMGCCSVMADTEDHRRIFGPEGDAVLYFSTPESLSEKCIALVRDAELRMKLSTRMREIIGAGHRYEDRLKAMLATIQSGRAQHDGVPSLGCEGVVHP